MGGCEIGAVRSIITAESHEYANSRPIGAGRDSILRGLRDATAFGIVTTPPAGVARVAALVAASAATGQPVGVFACLQAGLQRRLHQCARQYGTAGRRALSQR